MSKRVLPRTVRMRKRTIEAIYAMLAKDGFSQSESDEWLSDQTGTTFTTPQRWRRGDSIPMGERWSKVEEIHDDLVKEANGRPDAAATAATGKPRRTITRVRRMEPIEETPVITVEPGWDDIFGACLKLALSMPDAQRILLWHALGENVRLIHTP